MIRSRIHLGVCAALLLAGGGARAVMAQEVLLRNDNAPDTGASVAISAGYGPGEVAATTFTLSAAQQAALLPMKVKRVQILWFSQANVVAGFAAPDVVMESINVYRGGYSQGPPVVIPQLTYVSDPPLMVDGFLCEFDISLDEVILEAPLDKFTVGLEFDRDGTAAYYQGSSVFRPSVCYDLTTPPTQRNPMYTTNLGGWRDYSSLGAQGKDLVLRVVVEKVVGTPPGCNLADVTGIGGPPSDPDNQLTVDDIITFINSFSDGTGCPGAPDQACNLADVTGIGGSPAPPDGQLTVDDIISFFNSFSDGCV